MAVLEAHAEPRISVRELLKRGLVAEGFGSGVMAHSKILA
jgi:hypothetical protein